MLIIAVIAIILAGIMAMTSCTHDSAATPLVSFSKDIMPVMRASCSINSTCHVGANNTNGHIDLSNSAAYATLMGNNLVNIQNPTFSLLYSEILNGYMPKDPYGKLPANQITLILDWIKQGAKNN